MWVCIYMYIYYLCFLSLSLTAVVVVVMMKTTSTTWLEGTKVCIGMVAVQIIGAGLQILSRLILTQGTFVYALMVYRLLVGALSIAPFALLRESLSGLTNFSPSSFLWLFLNALTGITMGMGFFYYGLGETNATYATNFLNLIPTVTFLLSAMFGIEGLGIERKSGRMKAGGAVLSLGGALTMALYKGRVLLHKIPSKNMAPVISSSPHHSNYKRGTLFLACSCLSYGLWFITQVKLVKVYPYKYWATLMTCFIACLQNLVLGISLESSVSAWGLGWNLQLVTIIYSGTLASAATLCLVSWAVSKKGPTYPSMFNPLSLIFVAIAEALFLGEELTVGTLLGMVLIVLGLYSFLFGKSMELKAATALVVAVQARGGGEAGVVAADSPTDDEDSNVVVDNKIEMY